MTLCAYSILTALTIDPLALLLKKGTVTLPLINATINPLHFFIVTPLILTALHINLIYQVSLLSSYIQSLNSNSQLEDTLSRTVYPWPITISLTTHKNITEKSKWLPASFFLLCLPTPLSLFTMWVTTIEQRNPLLDFTFLTSTSAIFASALFISQRTPTPHNHLLIKTSIIIYIALIFFFIFSKSLQQTPRGFIGLELKDFFYVDLQNQNISVREKRDIWVGSEAQLQQTVGAQFEKPDLSFAKLNNSFLAKANLKDAILRQTNFSSANLTMADLSYSKLSASIFKGSWLDKAIFDGSTINYSIFTGSNLQNTSLQKINSQQSIFSGSKFIYTDFSSANLTVTTFYKATFEHTNFHNASFKKTNFSKTLHINSIFTGTYGDHVDFRNSTLINSRFNFTTLVETDFRNSTIILQDFSNASFFNCDFTNATIVLSKFERTKFFNCTFINTKLLASTFIKTETKTLKGLTKKL